LLPYQSILATMMNATVPTEYEVVIDGKSLVDERNAIRQGMVINLNGENVRVVLDDGIPESNNANDANCQAGEYASDVYLLPIRYLGGRPAMRIEYKDYRFITGEIAATNDMIGGFYQPSPDGRFSYSLVRDGRCFKIQAETEPRIILKTPQLARTLSTFRCSTCASRILMEVTSLKVGSACVLLRLTITKNCVNIHAILVVLWSVSLYDGAPQDGATY